MNVTFFKRLIISFFLALSFSLQSFEECGVNPYSWDFISFRGELLLFRPTFEHSYYVIDSSNNRFGEDIHPNGIRHNNPPNVEPGLRLEAFLLPCGCTHGLDFRFTLFNAKQSDSERGRFLFDTMGFPGNGSQAPEDTTYNGQARLRDRFRYYGFDANLDDIALAFCPENLTFFVGLHYAYIYHRSNFQGVGFSIDDEAQVPVNNQLINKSRFWGIGPQFGIKYEFPISCSCFDLFLKADSHFALLASKTHSSFHYITARTGPVGVNIRNKPLWRVTPMVDARISLNYPFECCHCLGSIEVGYELLWYSQAINSIVGYDVAFAGDSIDYYSNLHLQGPFIALDIAF